MKIEQANKLINKHENEDIPKINSQLEQKAEKSETKNIQQQVNNLVLQAGNPDTSSAEIIQARGEYSVLNDRLNAIDNTINTEKNNILKITRDEFNPVKEEVEKSKVDYFGTEHNNLEERLNEDFDNVHQRVNESSLLPYEGTNITADNSYYGLIKDLSIKGRTLQNLITTISEDRVKYISNLIKSNTTYTIILTKVSGSGQINTYGNDTTTTPHGLFLEKEASNGTYIGIRTTGENTNELTIMNITKNSDLILENVMILEGDYTNTPLSELPYVEGIKSIGENEVTEDGKYRVRVKSCGKNLINDKIFEDNSIYYMDSGKREVDTNFKAFSCSIKTNTNYCLTVNSSAIFQIALYKNGKFIKGNYFSNSASLSILGDYDLLKVSVHKNGFESVQLEEGTVATDYEPYKEQLIEYLLDEPPRSVPNGACDVLDVENGTVTRKIFKLVVDGSLKLGARGGYSNGDYTEWYIGPDVLPNPGVNYNSFTSRGNSICDKLPTPKKGESLSNYGEWCFVNGLGGLSVRLLNTKLSTTEDTSGVRQWLSKNPVTLYYVLKTPIVEQLKEHHPFSYEGTTHIFSDNLLPPTISCSIPSNVPAVISSLRLENETLNNEVATLSLENEELKEANVIQDEVIDISLLATDEMYSMLEPILGMTAEISTLEEVGEVSKMVELYVVMIQRKLKTIDQVPERYREEVQALLKEIEK